ncbi:guanidinopropionase [Rhodovulum iodosum]|uniref:Guanidinopropionase n=1 Tax=Rhodovulum iodosum TaxID=68291 RepID=A0ABV3XWQ3_9RHOB|nr:agmatinase [Rhodovulum robiginosum]RSK32219.1 agmatinase [Rhodovulum robiginosum]
MIPIDPDYLPVSGLEVPRFAGIASVMRLPLRRLDAPKAAEIGFLGVPWDSGTTNRPGARHGPRALRDASTMIRMVNQATRVAPFHTARCADFGDATVNLTDIEHTLALVADQFARLDAAGVAPVMMGGDHLMSLPLLRAMAKDGPLGFVHFDAHTDLFDSYFGGVRYTHGTPFRRAVEEGLLDPSRMVQIGIRGTTYDGEDRAFAAANGIRIVSIEEFRARGADDVMAEARDIVGGTRVHLSFDIDAIDPALAPGTGTPEIGGFTAYEAQHMLRTLDGLDIVSADLVEVAPPFDPSGTTAWIGASLLFEILCIVAGATARRHGRKTIVCDAIPEAGALGGTGPN